ncbi:MAG: helix-turn-helix transcriptional regulator [Alphaproteobacteria bacterium]|nr:helix-turn-helix transcriptional regulator [Alphaproteobacteria bacterium]
MARKRIIPNTCGKRIKMARVGRDMKQVDLAAAVSVDSHIEMDQNVISAIERGVRHVKDIELLAFCDALGVKPLWLMFGDDVPEKYR